MVTYRQSRRGKKYLRAPLKLDVLLYTGVLLGQLVHSKVPGCMFRSEQSL